MKVLCRLLLIIVGKHCPKVRNEPGIGKANWDPTCCRVSSGTLVLLECHLLTCDSFRCGKRRALRANHISEASEYGSRTPADFESCHIHWHCHISGCAIQSAKPSSSPIGWYHDSSPDRLCQVTASSCVQSLAPGQAATGADLRQIEKRG